LLPRAGFPNLNAAEQAERRLIEAAQADAARFVDIYEAYFPRVWAFTIARAGSRAEAEDVASEVFHKAFEALPRFEWRGVPLAVWLLRIAQNALIRRWEKSRHLSAEPAPEAGEPDGALEDRTLLFQLVGRLPDAQRQVIELYYVEGLTLAEAGHRLGRTEGAAKQLHRRALADLREQWNAGKEKGNV
jgi:RNA polymerase sigma-70 factor, ECF subfamily